jgi:hypothetical protein
MTLADIAQKHNELVAFLRQQAREQALRFAELSDETAALRQRVSVLESELGDLV